MLRLLFIIALSSLSSLAFADGPPMLFQPAEKDVSLYYLGEIFGAGLVPGGAETYLLSNMFEVFNTVCLTVAMIIIIYTLIVGVLETAGQGKVLGEKWSATWLPIRIMLGIALLVPKAGSGYVLAQSIVMWMGIQGVGAADQLWNTALDYFIQGGAVFANEQQDVSTPVTNSYMNKKNVENTYALERVILVNATCVEAHNASESAGLTGEYEIYRAKDANASYDNYVNFGNPDAWDNGNGGRECGYIIMPDIASDLEPDQIVMMKTAYNDAFYYMSNGLARVAEFLAGEDGADGELWEKYFDQTQSEAISFIEYLNASAHLLNPAIVTDDRAGLEELKQYGWILAGNYYMTLASYKDELGYIKLDINDYKSVQYPPDETRDNYPEAFANAEDYWETASTDARASMTFSQWELLYVIPGYGDVTVTNPGSQPNQPEFTYADLSYIDNELAKINKMANVGRVTSSGGLETADARDPLYYLQEMTNFGKTRVGDPIHYAAKFGGKLTEIATIMVVTAMAAFLVIAAVSGLSGPCFIASPGFTTFSMTLIMMLAPAIFGIAAFMYVQGALLSVALPLIPFVIFFVAALGWFIAMIEMIVSAPLVAVGLVFPETNQDIWGKAEPAFMMILNLFLRPPLIVLGFVAGMILTWIAVELLNTTFYLFLKDGAKIENMLFGFMVVLMAYVGLLITVVEKTFSLTTELPNKVLQVLGDRTQAQPGAEAMLQGAKGGVEKGGAAVSGAMTTAGGAAEKSASTGISEQSRGAARQEEGKHLGLKGSRAAHDQAKEDSKKK